jgi:hypothetical protein
MGSERGIAMIWWVIVLLVLFLAAGGLAYDRYADGVEKAVTIAKLRQDLDDTEKLVQKELDKRQALSNLVGFKAEASDLVSEPARIDDAIQSYKEIVQDAGQDQADKTLETILQRFAVKYRSLVSRLAEAETQRDKARSDEDAARETHSNQIRGKEQRITELETDKQQVEDRLTNMTTTKDQAIEELRGRVSQLQEDKATLASEYKKKEKDYLTQIERQTNLAKDASKHYASVRRNNNADGRIVARVAGSNKVYINIGARNGLKEGTTFETYVLAKGNQVIPKGNIIVQEVKAEYSLAAIQDELDRFDPVAEGDLIRNPLFASGQRPKFFLMGDMTGRLTNQETEALIRKLGGEVVKKVTPATTFVVIGRKESENAQPFANRDDYQLAKLFNIEFIDSQYLIDYLTN